MQEPDLIDLFVSPLEESGIDSYMISGSVASIEYGEPRATLDIDIAIVPKGTDNMTISGLFPSPEYYCPPADVLAIEIGRPNRGHFNVIHIGSGLKADFYPSRNHPYLPWALKHRVRIRIGDRQVWLAPPEYVILWKLEFMREGGGDKHARDIRGMLKVSSCDIDLSFVEAAVEALRLGDEWRSVSAR